MDDQNKYFDRELSWLSFNRLVLEQAKDTSLPLFERIKFCAIYDSNLDEFYRVRVAHYQSLTDIPKKSRKTLDYSPKKVLAKIKEEVTEQQKEFEDNFYNSIIPELEKNKIILWQGQKLEKLHKDFLKDYFSKEVLPEIQPVLLSSDGEIMPFLKDNVIYLALKMHKKSRPADYRSNYAVIQVPSNTLDRFTELPKLNGKYLYMFLEDIIRKHLNIIFPGYDITASYSIKLSRNADLMIEDEFSGNLLNKLKKSLKQRKTGFPARFSYDRNIPRDLMHVLKAAFNLSEKDFFPTGKYLNFSDLFKFKNPLTPLCELQPLKQLQHPVIDKYDSIIDAVNKNDILLHFPYQTYDYVLRFFHEAATDPEVEEIKATQYRAATNSAVVNALIAAAGNGKEVTVFVEVKARFDEENNIAFADKMRKAGINVIASIPGLKVHAKAAIAIKRTPAGKKKTYAFVSTGNFNEKTATQYADEGFFTSDKNITKDLEKLFFYLENPVEQYNFKHILVPGFNMISVLKEKINREKENAENGKKAYVILKVNGIGDKEIIDMLYDAGSSGVKTDLIVRGICKLRPGMPFSPNITATRIVDRFLEHARIYAFYNSGDWDIYISSSDFLTRNLRRRIETAVPIYDEDLKKEITDILKIQLRDNTKAKLLDKNIRNTDKKIPKNGKKYRAQTDIYDYLKKKINKFNS
ncbi:MAG: polyphosphate kinase 1 [Chlorobi bacterium]|nr:polyphosphate kinase 1 [Chlorobiota bacterium]